ncbi:MAG: efflux RND transporter periplasmic adaptor subunit [Pseudodonghicola sp.]|nr:efflux RND transporter periplasmic adaptor subunit [Pseudodonghicola sp.]
MKIVARVLLAILLAAAIGGSVWVYQQRSAPQPTTMLTLYGNVDIREVRPAFNASGTIMSILVDEGAAVKQGQLLATIDDTRYAAALAQAKATAVAARVAAKNDEVIYKRLEKLMHSGTVATEMRDDAKAVFDAAQASYDAAVASVTLAQRELDDTRLYAPQDGVIENRILQPGDMASPSAPVFTMALPNPLWVRAYVAESKLGHVRTGQAATITTDSYPDRVYHGWVGYLSSTAEFTPKTVETSELRTALVYQLRVIVCDGHGELRLGMPATVTIDLTQPEPTAHPGCDGADANAAKF